MTNHSKEIWVAIVPCEAMAPPSGRDAVLQEATQSIDTRGPIEVTVEVQQ